MVIQLCDESETPIYQQLYHQIVAGISDGRLEPGERLPTVRALASEIGVNAMTVNKAYQQLKQEGFIFADRRNGARVRESFGGEAGLSRELRIQLEQIVAQARARGVTREQFLRQCEALFEGRAEQ